jgi:hypothetical protein
MVSDDEISLLDYRYIVFEVGDLEVTRLIFQNPKQTNWETYQETQRRM